MIVEGDIKINFSSRLTEFIEKWKIKPGNLIMILHKIQEEFGFVPRQAALKVSKMLDVPLAKIYGVITFYHFFKLKKPGTYNIQVCIGTACYLKGGNDLIEELESLLGIGINSVTEDGLFSIEAVRCIGCCGLAPVMAIGEEVYSKVGKEELPEIIARLKENNIGGDQ